MIFAPHHYIRFSSLRQFGDTKSAASAMVEFMAMLDSVTPGVRATLIRKSDCEPQDIGFVKLLKIPSLALILSKNIAKNEFRTEPCVFFDGQVNFAGARFEYSAHFQTPKSSTPAFGTPLWLGIQEDKINGTDPQMEQAMHTAYFRGIESFKPEAAVCSASSLTEHIFARLTAMDPHPSPNIFHIVPGQQETGTIGYKMYFAKSVVRITVQQTAFDVWEDDLGYYLSLSDRLSDAFTEECTHALAMMCLELESLEDWPKQPGHIMLRDKALRSRTWPVI